MEEPSITLKLTNFLNDVVIRLCIKRKLIFMYAYEIENENIYIKDPFFFLNTANVKIIYVPKTINIIYIYG